MIEGRFQTLRKLQREQGSSRIPTFSKTRRSGLAVILVVGQSISDLALEKVSIRRDDHHAI